jgi:hypothetical protein
MVFRGDMARALCEEAVLSGTPAWPTYSLLHALTDEELKLLHDVFITKDLTAAVSKQWLEENRPLVDEVKNLLSTMQWAHQREVAIYYREEISRRESERREMRMERLTLLATIAGAGAFIVAILTLAVTI